MAENIIYRNYKDSDSLSIAEIEKICFSEPWSKAAIEEFMSYSTGHTLVASLNEAVVGYITFITVLDEVQIANVAIHPNFRRNHIGENLLKELDKLSLQNNSSFITLEVRASNEPAIRLYKKCGYNVVGERKNFYKSPAENAVLMNKVL